MRTISRGNDVLGEPRIRLPIAMDVGVDTHDFAPWHFDEIRERMKRRLLNMQINQTEAWHV
ncbi:MAG TPA: hypothetical protein VN777_13820 [Terriglobales bacterium]|jgi:hypothetical protein|nr:hypothetical protein [Terriglobales bacterium]